MWRKLLWFVTTCTVCVWAASPESESLRNCLFAAVQANDLTAVRSALAAGADVNSKDPNGEATPLMYAAFYGDAQTVRLLLDKGAQPNLANAAGATALSWGTNSLATVRVLVEHGADVNVRSKLGKTPLLIAASRTGSGPVVRYLVEHGANLDVRDTLEGVPPIPYGGGGASVLVQAAKAVDGEALRYLLRQGGIDINAREKNGGSALMSAVATGNTANALLLLERGADANAALITGMTPLMVAIARNDETMAAALLRHGANVNAEDVWGNTAVLWAAQSEYGRSALSEALTAAGADLTHRNKRGESALTIAMRRGDSPLTKWLRAKGLSGPDAAPAATVELSDYPAPAVDPVSAVQRCLPVLQRGGANIFKERGCTSCHNNMLPTMVAHLAQAKGLPVDRAAVERDRKTLLGILRPAAEMVIENGDQIPDMEITLGMALLTLNAGGYPADHFTDALVHNLANRQKTDGHWTNWAPRPPIEYGDLQATVLTMRALQLYAIPSRQAEFAARIQRAAEWIAKAEAHTTEDENWRLLGLVWTKADPARIAEQVARLRGLQRTDGGWAQLPGLPSDAYATGQVLYALHEAGAPVDERAVQYLLRTQQPDGTWLVKSRAFPFQPPFESGFPHGADQWISSAGSSWAALALLHAGAAPSPAMAKLHD